MRFLNHNPKLEHSDFYEHSEQMNILMNILIKMDPSELNQITSRELV